MNALGSSPIKARADSEKYPLKRAVLNHSEGRDYRWITFESLESDVLKSFTLYQSKDRTLRIKLIFQTSPVFESFLKRKGFVCKQEGSSTTRCKSKGKAELITLFNLILAHNTFPEDHKAKLFEAVGIEQVKKKPKPAGDFFSTFAVARVDMTMGERLAWYLSISDSTAPK